MSRPCVCDRCQPEPWAEYTLGQCRLCWLYHHDLDYREHWDGAAAPTPLRPCRHLGAATGATAVCPSCSGTVVLKLFECALHGSCTPTRQVPAIACCATCPDRAPPPA